MLNFPRWKIIFVILFSLWGIVAAMPNFLSAEQRAALPSFLPSNTVNLGLDLRGGVHMLLAADADDVIRTRLENLAGDVRDIRRNVQNLNFRNIRVGEKSVSFEVTRDDMIELAREKLRPLAGFNTVNPILGTGAPQVTLDRSGRLFTLTLTEEGITEQKRSAVSRAMEVIRLRVDPEGTRDVVLQRQGEDRIILQVPGADDPDALRRLIETAAKLTFHDVDERLTRDDIERGRVGPGIDILPTREGGELAVKRRVIVSGEDLANARPGFDEGGRPAVLFNLNNSGARRFGNHTRDNINRPFAIVLDGTVIQAPNIKSAIYGGSVQITGGFTVAEATEMATLLSAGSLPVPLQLEAQSTVGPDLGADSIQAGQWASVIGFTLVIIYMLLSYGRFGLAANMALIVNLMLILGLLSILQATLTLPGIAGIVLTIGMAVDANVLVFERIREEQRAGRKPLGALEAGYSEAFSTILDANITTFIAAVILYLLGTGPVQGFAVTLAIGIITSMFTAILLTRLFLRVWFRRARPATLPI